MKIVVRKDADRIHKKDTWKTSAYAFVPYQTHFGELCGFADDVIEPGAGFGMHPHQNMEISTIVATGAQVHKDSTGGVATIDETTVQVMSACTGIMHSEFNASETKQVHSFQIWVYPKLQNVAPGYRQCVFKPADNLNNILLVISPDGRNQTATINQDAYFSLLELQAGHTIVYKLHQPGNGVYIHHVAGHTQVEGYEPGPGDGVGVYETDEVTIGAVQHSKLIFVEVPMHRGVKL